MHGRRVLALVVAGGHPLAPEGLRLRERLLRVDGCGRLLRGWKPRQDERHPVTAPEGEFGDVRHPLGLEVDRGAEHERVGTADRQDRLFVDAPDPRDDRSVVEAHHELGAHHHVTLETLDDPNDVGLRLARRHEVDDADAARVGPPFALEDERLLPVPPGFRLTARDGRQEPATFLRRPEQRTEARARVEAREAEPVDGA